MWRKAEIVPLLKKGKTPKDASSYRPISLTRVCCKLTVLVERLNRFIQNNKIICTEQAAFRKHNGTLDYVAKFS